MIDYFRWWYKTLKSLRSKESLEDVFIFSLILFGASIIGFSGAYIIITHNPLYVLLMICGLLMLGYPFYLAEKHEDKERR